MARRQVSVLDFERHQPTLTNRASQPSRRSGVAVGQAMVTAGCRGGAQARGVMAETGPFERLNAFVKQSGAIIAIIGALLSGVAGYALPIFKDYFELQDEA